MQNWYKHLLTGIWLLLPLVVLAWRNRDWSRRDMARRALFAVAACWVWFVFAAMAITEIDLTLAAGSEEVARGAFGDRLQHSKAFLFGWLPSLILVAVWCGVIVGVRAIAPERAALARGASAMRERVATSLPRKR